MKKGALRFLATLFVIAFLFAGCSEANQSQDDSAKEQTTETKATEEKKDEMTPEEPSEPITLKFWTTWTPSDDGFDPTEAVIAKFEEDHPNVTIEKTTMAWDDMQKTITPALRSGEGPDVFNYTPGPGNVGVMAEAGLLFDMTDYVDGLGWKGLFPEWYFDEHKVDGRQYGMSNSETLLGLFYNKQVFADNELEVPKTYEELLAACETLKGEMTPISIAMKDQWETFHYATMYYTAFAGADALVEAEISKKGFEAPEFVAGLQAFVDLIENGYTSSNPNGISYDDSLNEFQAGESAMVMTGTWMATDLYDTMGENVGFFSFPPADGIEPGLSGGTGDEFLINADTEYPQIALELVDAIVSDPNTWVYAYLPVSKVDDPASLGLSPVQQEIYNEIMNASGIAAILDLYMPSYFNEEIQNLGQELVAGIKTPEEMSSELQSVLDNEDK